MDRRDFLKVLVGAPVVATAVAARVVAAEPQGELIEGEALRVPERLPGQDYAVYFEGRIVGYASHAEVRYLPKSAAARVEWFQNRFGIKADADARIPVYRLE